MDNFRRDLAHRSRELGVRTARGGRIQEVVGLVVWQGVSPGLVGFAFGITGALAGGRVTAGLLFEVEPHDFMTFAVVTMVLLAVVGVACIVPASRAGKDSTRIGVARRLTHYRQLGG